MNVLSIFLTIGLPAIDESLDKLLVMRSDWHVSSGCCLPFVSALTNVG